MRLKYGAECYYNPKKFPGLHFRPHHRSNWVITVYVTGKVVIKGPKTRAQVTNLWIPFYVNILQQFVLRDHVRMTSSDYFKQLQISQRRATLNRLEQRELGSAFSTAATLE